MLLEQDIENTLCKQKIVEINENLKKSGIKKNKLKKSPTLCDVSQIERGR